MRPGLSDEMLRSEADRIMKAMATGDNHLMEDLRQVLNRLWIERLEFEAATLASNAGERDVLERLKMVRSQIQSLRATL